MSHSPGPWRTGPINYADVYDGNGALIALLIKDLDGTVDNARLVTAAPDLLAACRVVKAFLDQLESDPLDVQLNKLRRKVHAPLRAAIEPAIAKAEGK